MTRRIRPHFFEWRDLFGVNDLRASEIIKDDKINILFDLSGHTQYNRLPLFAWKPAPIQATWLGYFASTGIEEMDYIVGDQIVCLGRNRAVR